MQVTVEPRESRVDVRLETDTEEASYVYDLIASKRLIVDKPDELPLPFRGQFLFHMPGHARPIALQVSRLDPTGEETLAGAAGPRLLVKPQGALTPESLQQLADALREVPPGALGDDEVLDGAAEPQDEFTRIRKMNHAQRIIYATRAGQSGRLALMQQPNPLLLLYLCKNPLITLPEVVSIAKMPSIDALVADYIVRIMRQNPQWALSEELRVALVCNPKTPGGSALSLLRALSSRSLRNICKAGEVRSSLKQAAIKMLTERHE